MNSCDKALDDDLQSIRNLALYRQLHRIDSPQGTAVAIAGKPFFNFSSNDYLGLANHTRLKEAACEAVGKFGAGSGASRLICGSLAPHHQLEEDLAAFKNTEAALVFSSGYSAAVGTLGALVGSKDVVIVDRLAHASLIDGARLSGARLRVFAHNDLNALEKVLQWSARQRQQGRCGRTLIVTESVFSMDGDVAPLKELVSLKEKYDAWLMLDEAHATGLLGENRRGLAEACGVADRIEVQFGTLGKALGSAGGYVCGSRVLVEVLVNRARSFIFSTAGVPAASAAASAGIAVVCSPEGEQLRQQCWRNVELITNGLTRVGFRAGTATSAILPVMIGDETKAMAVADQLRARGFFIPAIRYPTVARGKARLRISASAAHTHTEINALTNALMEVVHVG